MHRSDAGTAHLLPAAPGALSAGRRYSIGDRAITSENAMERARDRSHTTAQTVPQFRSLIRGAGLRLVSEELRPHSPDFDLWMRNAGSVPGDSSSGSPQNGRSHGARYVGSKSALLGENGQLRVSVYGSAAGGGEAG